MFGISLFKKKNQQTQQELEKEFKRRKNQANLILGDFIVHKTLTTVDLEQRAFNYTARVSDLRKRGYKITASYVKPGVYKYTYGGLKVK